MNKERLQKIEQHLRSGQLGHEVFDFSCINYTEFGEPVKDNTCGSMGCAMGEFPIIFPEYWKFYDDSNVVPIHEDDKQYDLQQDVALFLDIPEYASDHLFFPNAQDTAFYGGIALDETATKEQVADNIAAFIVKMETDPPLPTVV